MNSNVYLKLYSLPKQLGLNGVNRKEALFLRTMHRAYQAVVKQLPFVWKVKAPALAGCLLSLALSACTGAKQASEPEPFQPTQTQVNRTQLNQAQTNPAQPTQAQTDRSQSIQASQPTQAANATTVPFQGNQTQTVKTQTVKTQTIQTRTVPFHPTQAQVVRAQQQLGAHVTEQQIRIVLPADILFDFDRATIRPDAAAALQQTLTVIRYYKDAPIRIEGHTDSKGSDAYNQTLSEQRSTSVQQWLVGPGNVLASRLTTQGFGESQPRVPNSKPDGADDPVGRQLNRRVEIVVQKQ